MEKSITLDIHVSIVLGPTESRGIVGTNVGVNPEEPPSTGYGHAFAVSEPDVGASLILNPAVVTILVMLKER